MIRPRNFVFSSLIKLSSSFGIGLAEFWKDGAPETVVYSDMKHVQLMGLCALAALFVSCETTQTTGTGNQEQKRLAAIQKEQQEGAQMDEADRNLWNAHQDQLNTGS